MVVVVADVVDDVESEMVYQGTSKLSKMHDEDRKLRKLPIFVYIAWSNVGFGRR